MAKRTSKDISNAIDLLRRLLEEEYGTDYAYIIMGNGQVIGSSNRTQGIVIARANGDGDTGTGTSGNDGNEEGGT